LSFGELTAAWPQILELMQRRYMPLVRILQKASVKSLNGRTLTLVVGGATQKGKLQDDSQIIRAAILRITQFSVEKINVLVADEVQKRIDATIDDDALMRGIMNDHPSQITGVEDSKGGF
jgi:hypothetical protein